MLTIMVMRLVMIRKMRRMTIRNDDDYDNENGEGDDGGGGGQSSSLS